MVIKHKNLYDTEAVMSDSKKKMLALEPTSRVGRNTATEMRITPENISATQGVLLFLDILENDSGSIRSRPRA